MRYHRGFCLGTICQGTDYLVQYNEAAGQLEFYENGAVVYTARPSADGTLRLGGSGLKALLTAETLRFDAATATLFSDQYELKAGTAAQLHVASRGLAGSAAAPSLPAAAALPVAPPAPVAGGAEPNPSAAQGDLRAELAAMKARVDALTRQIEQRATATPAAPAGVSSLVGRTWVLDAGADRLLVRYAWKTPGQVLVRSASHARYLYALDDEQLEVAQDGSLRRGPPVGGTRERYTPRADETVAGERCIGEICAPFVLRAAAAQELSAFEAARQAWGPLTGFVGRTWRQQGDGERWTLRVLWAEPGRRMVEYWDLDGAPLLAYSATLHPDGRLRREGLGGGDKWEAEHQADGSILWRGGLLTLNQRLALGPKPGALSIDMMGKPYPFRLIPAAQYQPGPSTRVPGEVARLGLPESHRDLLATRLASLAGRSPAPVPIVAAEASPTPPAAQPAATPAATPAPTPASNGTVAVLAGDAWLADARARAEARSQQESSLRAQAIAKAEQEARAGAVVGAKVAALAQAQARKDAAALEQAVIAERAQELAAARRASGGRQAAAPANTQPIEEKLTSGDHDEVLALVEAMERRSGPSPRLESLRALALEGAGRKMDAFRSLLAYSAMTRNADLKGDEAHEALIALRDKLRVQLQQEQSRRREQEQRQRQEEARKILADSTAADRRAVQEMARRVAPR